MRTLWVVLGTVFLVTAARAGEIHDAVAAGDRDRVAALLRADPGLLRQADTNRNRDLPLHTAAITGQLEIARLLLDTGAEVDAFDVDESTPLHDAALNRHPEIVALLLSRGADVNRRDRNGACALSFAISGRDSTVVDRILQAGADLNFHDVQGNGLMHMAASRGFWAIVDRLLARGEDINQANPAGQTPLHWICYSRDVTRVREALARGARAAVADTGGATPLHFAAERGSVEIARLLIEHGAQIDAADDGGWTPLAAALVQGQTEVAQALLERGADPNRTVWQGTPVSFLALMSGSPALMRAILDAGAHADAHEPGLDRTLVLQASEQGFADIVALALDRGCPIDARDSLGLSALDIARRYGHTTVAQMLESRGVKGASAAECDEREARVAPGEARVWYLGHSGWAIETANHFLVFDYGATRRAPDAPSLCNGSLTPAALVRKPVTVFASHEHGDHYQASIFDWRAQNPEITYVIGFRPPDATGYEYVPPRETREIGGVKVTTIPANDTGEGFWVEVDGLTVFHAGDHACRTRDLSGDYTPEIQFLAQRGVRPDLAFLPISGCNFGDQEAVRIGAEYTLRTLKPKVFLPMHAGRQTTERYRDFIRACGDRFAPTGMPTLYCAGDHFTYRDGRAMGRNES